MKAVLLIICTLCAAFAIAQKAVLKPLEIGDTLPFFQVITSGGDTIDIMKLRSKILVINFWSSWNLASRKYHAELVAIYRKIMSRPSNRRRADFISISMDTRYELWRLALAKDNLPWKLQYCDLRGWESDLVSELKVSKLPSNFIVDGNGVIVAKDVWGKNLETYLQKWILY
jgi:peroxiredoxin